MTEAVQDLGPADLDLVQNVLHYYPGVSEIVTLVKRIDSLGYPVNSLEELLTDAPDIGFRFAGRAYDHTAVRRFIPAYYFPIANQHDLVAKLVELHRISRMVAGRQSRAAVESRRSSS